MSIRLLNYAELIAQAPQFMVGKYPHGISQLLELGLIFDPGDEFLTYRPDHLDLNLPDLLN
jgi:hypothetical protein